MTATAERSPRGHSISLDALRAFPALIVMQRHLLIALFSNDAEHSRLFLVRAMFGLSKTVNSAVVVLVVLSGYIVGGGVIRAARRPHPWRFDTYALNRVTRLWNVLIPALILGYVIDRGGIALFGERGVYGGHTTPIVFYNVKTFTTALVFVANSMFLGTIKAPSFGTNGSLWTVNFEFWFYFLGAALLYGVFAFRKSSWQATAVRVGIVVGIAAFVQSEVLRYFVYWCVGAAASMVPVDRVRASAAVARATIYGAAVASVIVGLVVGARYYTTGGHKVLLVSALFTAAAIPLLVGNERADDRPRLTARVTAWLAAISFSLYATHVPLLIFYRAWLEHHGRAWSPSNATMIATIVPIALLVLFAWGFAQLTERRLPAMRAWVRRAGGRLASD